MDGEESAKLRLAADVFILAIQTDAFSGSLQEYLYGGPGDPGEWLVYPQLGRSWGSKRLLRGLPEIPALLLQALANPDPGAAGAQGPAGDPVFWEAAGAWLAPIPKGKRRARPCEPGLRGMPGLPVPRLSRRIFPYRTSMGFPPHHTGTGRSHTSRFR